MASPVAGMELLRPGPVSAGRRRFWDSVGGVWARAYIDLVTGASSSRIVNEIRRRFGSTSNTLTRTTSPGFATLRGSLTGTVNLSGRVTRMQASGTGHWGLFLTYITDLGPDLKFLGPRSS